MFPLALSVRATPVDGRIVSIGNAAQTLHPVAGQGLNLGLRDAASLAIALRDWMVLSNQQPSVALRQFLQMRQPDRQLTTRLTDLMSRVFTSGPWSNTPPDSPCWPWICFQGCAHPWRDTCCRV
jgi:2-octaprenyl-6-methoxyphenol hydroxylase